MLKVAFSNGIKGQGFKLVRGILPGLAVFLLLCGLILEQKQANARVPVVSRSFTAPEIRLWDVAIRTNPAQVSRVTSVINNLPGGYIGEYTENAQALISLYHQIKGNTPSSVPVEMILKDEMFRVVSGYFAVLQNKNASEIRTSEQALASTIESGKNKLAEIREYFQNAGENQAKPRWQIMNNYLSYYEALNRVTSYVVNNLFLQNSTPIPTTVPGYRALMNRTYQVDGRTTSVDRNSQMVMAFLATQKIVSEFLPRVFIGELEASSYANLLVVLNKINSFSQPVKVLEINSAISQALKIEEPASSQNTQVVANSSPPLAAVGGNVDGLALLTGMVTNLPMTNTAQVNRARIQELRNCRW